MMKKAIKTTLIICGAVAITALGFATGFSIATGQRIGTLKARLAADRAKTRQAAWQDTLRPYVLKARRGDILDCNGNVLSRATTVYDIHFDPCASDIDGWELKVHELSAGLEKYIGEMTASEYEEKILNGRMRNERYLRLGESIDSVSMEKIKSLPFFDMKQAAGGMIVEPRQTREYPYGQLARRTIGYVRQTTASSKNKVGMEGSCDSLLSGTDGYIIMQSEWKRKPFQLAKLHQKEVESASRIDGADVRTTLDITVQAKADSVLRANISGNQSIAGACLVLADVNTGNIPAMVNLIRDKDNAFKEYYNVAIGYQYEPGRIISPALEIASARCGNEHFNAEDFIFGREQELIDSLKAVMQALNIGKWDIDGHVEPTFIETDDPEWSGVSLYSLGKGIGMTATSLDWLALYTAIARGGEAARLHLLADGVPETHRLCSSEKAAFLKASMTKAGGAVAGKTGKSYAPAGNRKYVTDDGQRAIQATFAGFFPADKPEYSVICLIYTQFAKDLDDISSLPSATVAGLAAAMCK